MITGVIYKYTCPVGKHYIGQTINECYRRGLFFLAKHYGGHKIDRARKEFGPENFTYEILIKNTYADIESAKVDLGNIVKCCQGKAKRVRNFIFKYNN